jgi:hypothetical protein
MLARPSVHEAFDRRFFVTRVFVDDGWPLRVPDLPDYQSYDAVISFVRFRQLERLAALEWGDFRGQRILYDLDAFLFLTSLSFRPANVTWPVTFDKHGFDWLLCTGKRVTEELKGVGLQAVWWPKAYDQNRFFDADRERRGFCHFGTLYIARQAMLHRLARADLEVRHLTVPFDELSDALNEYLGLLVCTLSNSTRTTVSRVLRKLNPEWGLQLSPGPEPMQKLFEGAGSGCAVFNDRMDELIDLGFKDGENIIVWQDFDELIDKIRWYRDRPEMLRDIGRSGHELCRKTHTWDERMVQLETLLRTQPRIHT